MATAVHIPVEEYLRTVYRPDCDYVDVEVQGRNLGEQTHSLVQKWIAAIFFVHRKQWGLRSLKQWGLRSLTEQRVQVAPRRFRIPDVCMVHSSDPIQPILHTPPVLCVEVLSPKDRFQSIQQRIREYQQMGVANTWVIDPTTGEIWTAEVSGPLTLCTHEALRVPNTNETLSIADIFEEIDEAPAA